MTASDDTVRSVTGDRLTTAQLHDLLRARTAVFVVEQQCAYQEVDGLDLRPDTTHLWLADDRGIAAYLRILAEDGATRIGRVLTRPDRRGTGVSRKLMHHALFTIGSGPTILSAQTYLAAYYESLGFVIDGPEFVEDGIPHVPMRRP